MKLSAASIYRPVEFVSMRELSLHKILSRSDQRYLLHTRLTGWQMDLRSDRQLPPSVTLGQQIDRLKAESDREKWTSMWLAASPKLQHITQNYCKRRRFSFTSRHSGDISINFMLTKKWMLVLYVFPLRRQRWHTTDEDIQIQIDLTIIQKWTITCAYLFKTYFFIFAEVCFRTYHVYSDSVFWPLREHSQPKTNAETTIYSF